jgi:hypothetical protein
MVWSIFVVLGGVLEVDKSEIFWNCMRFTTLHRRR